MGDSDTLTRTREDTALDVPWNVVVHDDPVNLMGYVTHVLMKVFGYDEKKALPSHRPDTVRPEP
jgi:ATP-dependent Clp protease adaptor protein ClpS